MCVMPAWGKVLTPQEVANVAEFVFQTFIHPESGKQTGLSPDKSDKKKAG